MSENQKPLSGLNSNKWVLALFDTIEHNWNTRAINFAAIDGKGAPTLKDEEAILWVVAVDDNLFLVTNSKATAMGEYHNAMHFCNINQAMHKVATYIVFGQQL